MKDLPQPSSEWTLRSPLAEHFSTFLHYETLHRSGSVCSCSSRWSIVQLIPSIHRWFWQKLPGVNKKNVVELLPSHWCWLKGFFIEIQSHLQPPQLGRKLHADPKDCSRETWRSAVIPVFDRIYLSRTRIQAGRFIEWVPSPTLIFTPTLLSLKFLHTSVCYFQVLQPDLEPVRTSYICWRHMFDFHFAIA